MPRHPVRRSELAVQVVCRIDRFGFPPLSLSPASGRMDCCVNFAGFALVYIEMKVVDAECTPIQRERMYASGGVYIVTSRVLIVDLLNKVLYSNAG